MDLYTVLEKSNQQILDQAMASLATAHFPHYTTRGETWTRARLAELFRQVQISIKDRDLAHLVRHCEQVATDRFTAGFEFVEVQTAFNSLEQAMWRTVTSSAPAASVIDWVGMLSSVLGAGKDAVARTYVHLASQRHVTSIDVAAMSEGTV